MYAVLILTRRSHRDPLHSLQGGVNLHSFRQLSRHKGSERASIVHMGIAGSERADCPANRGAWATVKVRNLSFNRLASQWARKNRTGQSAGRRQAKRYIKHSDTAHRLLKRKRSGLRLVTSFYMGHNSLRYHLKNVGISATDSCNFCQATSETSRQILFEYEATCRIGHRVFHEHFITLNTVRRSELKKMCGIHKSTKIGTRIS